MQEHIDQEYIDKDNFGSDVGVICLRIKVWSDDMPEI